MSRRQLLDGIWLTRWGAESLALVPLDQSDETRGDAGRRDATDATRREANITIFPRDRATALVRQPAHDPYPVRVGHAPRRAASDELLIPCWSSRRERAGGPSVPASSMASSRCRLSLRVSRASRAVMTKHELSLFPALSRNRA